jgi:hypothetical protein
MSWNRMDREIENWAATGKEASLWWRDDDAVAVSPALRRLLAIVERRRIPIALAVIPAGAEPGLAMALEWQPGITVLQHGYAHRNHAAEGARAVECGGARPLDQVTAELAVGRARLMEMFGPRSLPVLVPPWNRMDPALLPHLPDLGFRGLSTWGARARAEAAPDLIQVHTHADPIAWRKGRMFGGAERVIEALASHLQARREGRADPHEPTGLLTHHLTHDEPGWAFLEELAERLANRRGLRWVGAPEAFGLAA